MQQFSIAANDTAQAAEAPDYDLYIFQLPDRTGEELEDYAAVRPNDELLLTLTQDVYLLQDTPESSIDILNRIMLQTFNADDIRAALIEDGGYADTEGDGDGELSPYGLDLVRTNQRLKYRWSTNPKRDPLGTSTLAEIAVHLVERYTGKAIGKPQDFLPRSKPTGTPSKRTSSSRAGKTRGNSSRGSNSRASSTSRTNG